VADHLHVSTRSWYPRDFDRMRLGLSVFVALYPYPYPIYPSHLQFCSR